MIVPSDLELMEFMVPKTSLTMFKQYKDCNADVTSVSTKFLTNLFPVECALGQACIVTEFHFEKRYQYDKTLKMIHNYEYNLNIASLLFVNAQGKVGTGKSITLVPGSRALFYFPCFFNNYRPTYLDFIFEKPNCIYQHLSVMMKGVKHKQKLHVEGLLILLENNQDQFVTLIDKFQSEYVLSWNRFYIKMTEEMREYILNLPQEIGIYGAYGCNVLEPVMTVTNTFLQ
jgi:hypothetical protein